MYLTGVFQGAVTDIVISVSMDLSTMDLLLIVSLIGLAWRTR